MTAGLTTIAMKWSRTGYDQYYTHVSIYIFWVITGCQLHNLGNVKMALANHLNKFLRKA